MRILLTGAGGPASIGVARSLRKHLLVGVDANENALSFAETDKKYVVPRVDDSAYLTVLNEIIDTEAIEFVHAQPDPEVHFISDHRDQIHARTFLPHPETVAVCMNKHQTYETLKRFGVPVPKTRLLRGIYDLDVAVTEFGKPLWVRETVGAAGKGSIKASGFQDALYWVESLHKGWGRFIASEYLPGRLFTWQSLWKDGVLLAAQGRERLEWAMSNRAVSGVTGVTGVAVTTNDPRLDEIGADACRAVSMGRPHGIYGVDMKENIAGVPCVTEINIGRFFTTIEFFTRAGTNFPELYLQAAFGDVAPAPKLEAGLTWLRSMDCLPILKRA